MPDTIPNLHQWERGPKITAIGGGTGLSTMLRGLKKYTKNLTAVVTVADDGGGSGVLRRDIGMPPPGISATAWSPWPTWSRSWSGCSPTAFRRAPWPDSPSGT